MNPDELVKQADKYNENCWLISFYGFFDTTYKQFRQEEKADLYQKAGSAYKLNKQNLLAGDCFIKASYYYERAHCKIKMIYSLIDAYYVYKNFDNEKAVSCLNQIIKIYTEDLNCEKLMEYKFKMADLLKEIKKYDQSLNFYTDVADICETIPHCSQYKHKSVLNIAEIYITLENYKEASVHYDKYLNSIRDNNLLKLQIKENIFNAVLCKLYDETIDDGYVILDKYCNEYPNFETSRECLLLKGIIYAIQKNNLDEFTKCVTEYDKISRLKDWHVEVLLKIREKGFSDDNYLDLC